MRPDVRRKWHRLGQVDVAGDILSRFQHLPTNKKMKTATEFLRTPPVDDNNWQDLMVEKVFPDVRQVFKYDNGI